MFIFLDVLNTGIHDTVVNKPTYLCLDVLNTGIQDNVENKPTYLCLDGLNTGIQDNVENKPVFDPDLHSELIIKHENKDIGNLIINI